MQEWLNTRKNGKSTVTHRNNLLSIPNSWEANGLSFNNQKLGNDDINYAHHMETKSKSIKGSCFINDASNALRPESIHACSTASMYEKCWHNKPCTITQASAALHLFVHKNFKAQTDKTVI